MKTLLLPDIPENIKKCGEILRMGGLVAFPTETVYGLGANALDENSAQKIYAVKGRPSNNPLIVHLSKPEDAAKYVAEVPEAAKRFMAKFMPGPCTVVLKKNGIIPNIVTGGLDTVALRVPENEIARKLIAAAGVPICAPSANTSTRPSPTSAEHVFDDLNGKIEAILDGGRCGIGVESTIVDFTGEKPRILRLGGLSIEDIRGEIGEAEIYKYSGGTPLSPGMAYKHYAPSAKVYLALPTEDMTDKINDFYDSEVSYGSKPVIFCLKDNAEYYEDKNVTVVGQTADDYAHNLFYDFREADKAGYTHIIAEGVAETGVGAALMNRLAKASGGHLL